VVWVTGITFAHYTILYEADDSLTQQPKHVAVLLTNEECYADWNPWLLIIWCSLHNVRCLLFMRAIINFCLSRTTLTCITNHSSTLWIDCSCCAARTRKGRQHLLRKLKLFTNWYRVMFQKILVTISIAVRTSNVEIIKQWL
jgi:hypothetical protein